MKAVFVSFLIVGSLFSFSQKTTGYMGKRFVISYGGDFIPAGSATAKSATGGGFNSSHSLNFEYTVRRTNNICLSFRYFKTGIVVPGLSEYKPKDKLPMQLSSYNLGVGYKCFFDGFYAPVGKYVKPEFLLLINDVRYQKDGFLYFTQTGYQYQLMGSGYQRLVNFGITYQVGFQRIFMDKIVLDGGLRIGLMFNGALQNIGGIAFDVSTYTTSLSGKISNEVNNRIMLHEFFNLHVGIGFLAF